MPISTSTMRAKCIRRATGFSSGRLVTRRVSPEGQIDAPQDVNSKYGTSDIQWLRKRIDPNATRYEGKLKLKYLLPLDDDIADRIKSLSKHYPKKRATSDTSDTPGLHPGNGRAARTVALQRSTASRINRWRKQFKFRCNVEVTGAGLSRRVRVNCPDQNYFARRYRTF